MRPIRSRRAPQAGWLTPLLILGLFMTGLLGGFGLSRHTRSVAPTLVLPLRESSSHTTLLPPPRIPAPLTAAPPPSPSSPPPSPHPSSPPPSPAPPNVLGEPAEGRILFATFATGAMAEFLLNWVASVRAVGVADTDIVVATLDAEVQALCSQEGIPQYQGLPEYGFKGMATGGMSLGGEEQPAGDARPFQHLGLLKTMFASELLKQGHHVLLSDVDTVWLRDPRGYLRDPGEAPAAADAAVSTDCLSAKRDARAGEGVATKDAGCVQGQLNTGVMFFRPTAAAAALLGEWAGGLRTPVDQWENDQGVFNRVLARWRSRWRKVGAHTLHVHDQLTLALLPVASFCSGHVFFTQQLPKRLGVQPYVVHATYQFSHSLGKRQRMREAGLWSRDPQEYYTRGNFLSFDPTPPHQLAADVSSGLIARHMRVAAWYRLSVRNALALARVLDRTLIVPPFLCYCDRWWGNVLPTCLIPGSDQTLPFQCPMDHLFFLPNWDTRVQWREHSFLSNPRVPDAVRNSRATVQVVPAIPARVAAVLFNGTKQAVLAAGGSDREVVEALGGVVGVRVLHFASTATAFCRFEDDSDNVAFDALMDTVLKAEVWFCGERRIHRGRSCTVGYERPPPLAPLSAVDCKAAVAARWSARHSPQQLDGVLKEV